MLRQVILTATNSEAPGAAFVLRGQERVMIGRSSECALRLADPTVSRRHCLLDAGDESVWVRDLDSLNGTYVNGQQVPRLPDEDEVEAQRALRELHDGDRLKVGTLTYCVHLVTEEE